jgi:hypothetical protein
VPIEVRYAGTELDEIVAEDAFIHLEKMNSGAFALIVETRHERVCFWLTGRAAIEQWRDQINRRSEAQRRRWNALTPAQRKRRKR